MLEFFRMGHRERKSSKGIDMKIKV